MNEKITEKNHAIFLRKQGLTYSEILKQVPVAKSTISLWLHSVGLAKKQKQRITEKRKLAQIKGAHAKRTQREIKSAKIKEIARLEARELIVDSFWIAGLMLYWAKGGKEKLWRTGETVRLCNMDVSEIK